LAVKTTAYGLFRGLSINEDETLLTSQCAKKETDNQRVTVLAEDPVQGEQKAHPTDCFRGLYKVVRVRVRAGITRYAPHVAAA